MRADAIAAAPRAPAAARYTGVAIVLHWLIAFGIFAQIVLGLVMTQLALKQMTVFKLYQLHKSVGITVLLLVLLRILWRVGHRPPPLPPTMPMIERRAAEGTHWTLYAFMLGVPLTGWAMVSSSPYNLPTVLFGQIPWPDLPILSTLANKAPVEAAFKLLHNYAAWVLIPVIAVHAAAALRHHFIKRDTVLWRMLPLLPRPPV